MCKLDTFKVDLKDLKEDVTTLHFNINDDYFEAIDAPEVRKGDLTVDVTIQKVSGFFEQEVHIKGAVHIPCDICLDDMEQPIDCENQFVAKFGNIYNEDDDVVTVPEDEGILDLSWLIYEFIILDIPIKHVHAPGKCNPAMMKVLQEHSVDRDSEEVGEDRMDPRWDVLRKLKD